MFDGSGWLESYTALQWGHRFSSVEMQALCVRCHAAKTLQWGHRFSSVEMSGDGPCDGGDTAASMGPPIFIGGNVGSRANVPVWTR